MYDINTLDGVGLRRRRIDETISSILLEYYYFERNIQILAEILIKKRIYKKKKKKENTELFARSNLMYETLKIFDNDIDKSDTIFFLCVTISFTSHDSIDREIKISTDSAYAN